VTIAGLECGGAGLAPLSVLPEWQRQGIGSLLVNEGIAAVRTAGLGFVVVLGEPAYYSRFGFVAASRWGMSDEYGGGDAFQAMEMAPGAIPAGGGLVKYAPEFAVFGGEGTG
jgi:putative acetyltransferase